MSCPSVVTIQPTECIGNSLNTINNNYQSLRTGVCDNQDQINALRTLLLDLSSNMNKIGNYPYLEYAWVTAPNVAGQNIAANTITTLTVDTEIVDTGSHGSVAGNQITLAAGTYSYIARTGVDFSGTGGNNAGALSLYNITNSRYISNIGPSSATGADYGFFRLEGQFTITSSTAFDVRIWIAEGGKIRNSGGDNPTISTAGSDQRTTLQLWKIG